MLTYNVHKMITFNLEYSKDMACLGGELDIGLLASDKKRIHLFDKPSKAGADAERIGIYVQPVCQRGVAFSRTSLVNKDKGV